MINAICMLHKRFAGGPKSSSALPCVCNINILQKVLGPAISSQRFKLAP